ncbi:MAG: hypothetical protein DRQ47_02600 [Gammaproteobacteria bacterium]|nr:MAG: hypothetical protein DRQ47_02600 [Gammaproteobacteria bacterium]
MVFNSQAPGKDEAYILMVSIIILLLLLLFIAFNKIAVLKKHKLAECDTSQKAAMIGSWDWDIKNKTIYFSDTALMILGFNQTMKSLTDIEFLSYIDQKDKERHLLALETALADQTPYTMKVRFNNNRPYKKWIESRGKVFVDENGQPLRMVGMLQDVSYAMTETQLQEETKRALQDVIEHQNVSSTLTKICSAVSKIESSIYCAIYLYSNNTKKLKLHYCDNTPDALKYILNSITIEDQNSELSQTLNHSDPLYIENLNQLSSWQSANQILNSLNISAFYGQHLINQDQTTEGAICLYLQDKEIPREILEQILEVTSRVAAVAIDGQKQSDRQRSTQQQLYHSQKMDSIGHLTAGIAHDFNNILGSIVGYNSLAKKISVQLENSKLEQFLDEVNIASKRARDLINQMMIFSRSEPAQNVLVDTKPVIKEVLQLIKSMLPSSITIKHQLGDHIDNVHINPIALHQIIMNLLINAKDSAENDIGSIAIKLSQETIQSCKCASCHKYYDGEYVCIEVSDSGSGIPETVIEHIFDPFFSTKEIGAGTGMGLSVVHGIVHDSQGHITVESPPDSDTIFRLYFPAQKSDPSLQIEELDESDPSACFGHQEHIMVVDDDVPLSLLIEEILNSNGYKVSRFDDSQAALAAFLETPDDFQLIVSDQTMPSLTGDQMAIEMLKVKPNLPIIICTGYTEKLYPEHVQSIGIKTVLIKPVDTYELLETINKTLNEQSTL